MINLAVQISTIEPQELSLKEKSAVYALARKLAVADSGGQIIEGTEAYQRVFGQYLTGLDREEFVVAFVTSQHKIISLESLFQGTINKCPVYPRVVIKRALALNAAAIITGRNDIAGSASFSSDDKKMTKCIAEAGELLDIKLIDHILVAADSSVSYAEKIGM